MDSKLYVIDNEAGHVFKSNDFYVYMLVNPSTNVPFYVGKGRDARGWRHVQLRNNSKARRSNPHLYNTIHKIIEGQQQIIVRIVKTFHEESDAFVHEQLLIRTIGRSSDGVGPLTNINKGGEGNTSSGRSVDQYTVFGEYVATYTNAKEAARLNGWPHYTTISSCCTGRERSYKGFLWCYSGLKPVPSSKVRPVYQWSVGGVLLGRYRSISQAATIVKCDPSSINDCVNGYIRTVAGSVWSYANTPPQPRPNVRKRSVIHLNTNIVYDSVTAAAAATKHNIGAVSACCNGRRESIGGDRFSYIT